MNIQKITYKEPEINYKEIMRYLGVKAPGKDFTEEENLRYAEDNRRTFALLNECLDEVRPLLRYDICYGELSEEEFLREEIFDRELFMGVRSLVVFGATVGHEIDRLITKYQVTSVAKAQCFEAIGTERVEALSDAFSADVSMMARDAGLIAFRRVSPGYGKFKLEAQNNLFSLLNLGKNLGITLTESLLMKPSKSVTAVIAINDAPEEFSGCDTNKCASCSMGNCQFKG